MGHTVAGRRSAFEPSAGTAPSVGDAPSVGGALGEETDHDSVAELGDRIAVMAAHLHSDTSDLLTLIARFDQLRGWEAGGHRSCAHWLHFRTGYNLGTAREYVRVALALEDLPGTRAAMERGALSFCKVRALSRVARAETEADLLELAKDCTTLQLERVVRAWRTHSRLEEAELERQLYLSRRLSIFPEDGMCVLQARLPAEDGASIERAIDEMCDELYRAERASGAARETDSRAAAARRRADALVRLVERGLAAGLDLDLDDDEDSAEGSTTPVSGTRAQRYQIMLHVDLHTLSADGEPGRSELEDGTRISCETSRRVACDAGLVRVEQSDNGQILSVGRRTRTIPSALRRALEVRDRGCRFPGCGLRYTEAHHVVHWADGGETSLRNTVLLCRHHHRLVHEEGWKLAWWPHGRVAFTDPRGQIHVGGEMPRMPVLPAGHPEALARRQSGKAIAPGPYTASARWKAERDIPNAILFRALDVVL